MTDAHDRRSADGFRPDAAAADEEIRVLHVDDDAAFVDMAATFVEKADDDITVVTATGAADALDTLRERRVDCVVSDYNMPETDGLGFLRALRDRYPDLPFILFTGRGSEEIASDAISAGVTDYLQKETGADQYAVLANRIVNAVAQSRAERAVEETRDRFRKLTEESTDVISVVDANGRWQYLSPSATRVLGSDPEELVGDVGFDYVHPDDRPGAVAKFTDTVENPDRISAAEFRFDHPDGWIWLENYARNMVDDPVISGFVVHTREVTERVRREQELARQTERLEAVIGTISEDLRDPLRAAYSSLDRARDDDAALDEIESALDRLDRRVDDLLTVARDEPRVDERRPVDIETVSAEAWENAATDRTSFACESTATVLADRRHFARLFEALFRDAAERGDPPATVSVGATEGGFYVEDDGGDDAGGDVHNHYESTGPAATSGTEFGRSVAEQIAHAHGWEVAVSDGRDGGVRFEFEGVAFA